MPHPAANMPNDKLYIWQLSFNIIKRRFNKSKSN